MQGVFFRAAARRLARRLGLTGWVRNRSDGSVEVLAEGRRDELEQSARLVCGADLRGRAVTDVRATWQEASGRWTDFVIGPDTPRA